MNNINKMTILVSTERTNIGQMNINTADEEVIRMNTQDNTNIWHKDFSDYLYCPDQLDDDCLNPCPLAKDCCWITRSFTIRRVKDILNKLL